MFSFLLFFPSVPLAFALVIGCILRWLGVPTDRRRTEYVMVAAIFTVLVSSVAQAIANSLSRLRPFKYDLYIYRFDAFFGQPSFALGRIVQRHLWLELTLQVAYGILPIVVTSVIAAYIYLCGTEMRRVLTALAINLLAAPAFYLLLPVCGPQFAFPQFPEVAAKIAPHLIALNAAPNGFPSVHMSTALLLLYLCSRWRLGVILAALYALLIVASTLASGQHYLFDLFAAVPYAFSVAWVADLPGIGRRPRGARSIDVELEAA